MKTISLFFILSTFMCWSKTFAQGAYDHPEIGRYTDSEIYHQERSDLTEYNIVLQGINDKKMSEIKKLEGKVVMTLYKAKGETSSFEIYKAYKDLLISKNFEILFTCEKLECRGTGEYEYNPTHFFYNTAPFANDAGLNNVWPITNGNPEFSYVLTAKGENAGIETYVSLIVSAGYRDYPFYKLDVIDIVKSTKGIISVPDPGVEDENRIEQKTISSSKLDQSILKSPAVKSFEIKIGVGAYSFSDPMLAGSANNFMYNPTGVVTGSASGYRLMFSPYLNIRYFFNENFGISLDINHMSNNPDIYTTDKQYKSNANLFSQKFGLTGQIVGNSTPVRLSSTIGAGNCITELYQQIINIPSTGSDIYLHGKANMVVLFFNVDVSFPLYKKLFLFGDYEYNLIPAGTFVMEHDGGNDYSDTYYGINFGGSHFRLGLGYSF